MLVPNVMVLSVFLFADSTDATKGSKLVSAEPAVAGRSWGHGWAGWLLSLVSLVSLPALCSSALQEEHGTHRVPRGWCLPAPVLVKPFAAQCSVIKPGKVLFLLIPWEQGPGNGTFQLTTGIGA